MRELAGVCDRAGERGRSVLVRLIELPQLRLEVTEEHIEVARRARRAAELAQRLGERPAPVRVDVPAGRAEEGTTAPRRDAMPAQVVRVVAEPDTWVVRQQTLPLRLEHLPQAQDPRVVAERRCGNQLLAAEDPADQRHDLGGRGETARAGLPGVDGFAATETQAPDDAASEGRRAIVIPSRSRSRSTVSYSCSTQCSVSTVSTV